MGRLAGFSFLNKLGKLMRGENYLRIVKGYEPIEPAGFFEKIFYVFWLLTCAFKVILLSIRLNRARRNNEAGQEK